MQAPNEQITGIYHFDHTASSPSQAAFILIVSLAQALRLRTRAQTLPHSLQEPISSFPKIRCKPNSFHCQGRCARASLFPFHTPHHLCTAILIVDKILLLHNQPLLVQSPTVETAKDGDVLLWKATTQLELVRKYLHE